MAKGYVYILKNPAHRENHFKIGMTTRTVTERIKELSGGSGVPEPFEEVYSVLFDDCTLAEKQMHQLLTIYRNGKDREFFEVDLWLVIKQLGELKIKELETALNGKIRELEKRERLEIIANLENDICLFEGAEKYEKIFTFIQNLKGKNEEIIDFEEILHLLEGGKEYEEIIIHIERLKSDFSLTNEHHKNIASQILKIKMSQIKEKLNKLKF